MKVIYSKTDEGMFWLAHFRLGRNDTIMKEPFLKKVCYCSSGISFPLVSDLNSAEPLDPATLTNANCTDPKSIVLDAGEFVLLAPYEQQLWEFRIEELFTLPIRGSFLTSTARIYIIPGPLFLVGPSEEMCHPENLTDPSAADIETHLREKAQLVRDHWYRRSASGREMPLEQPILVDQVQEPTTEFSIQMINRLLIRLPEDMQITTWGLGGPYTSYRVCWMLPSQPTEVVDIGVVRATGSQRCGDGIVTGPHEECDQGMMPPQDGDGCSAQCTIEDGYRLVHIPNQGPAASPLVSKVQILPLCGDGKVKGDEECDDENQRAGDGCSPTCRIELGYTCDSSQPSVCRTACGNLLLTSTEQCEGQDSFGGDGCSPACRVEQGWSCTLREETVDISHLEEREDEETEVVPTEAPLVPIPGEGNPGGDIIINETDRRPSPKTGMIVPVHKSDCVVACGGSPSYYESFGAFICGIVEAPPRTTPVLCYSCNVTNVQPPVLGCRDYAERESGDELCFTVHPPNFERVSFDPKGTSLTAVLAQPAEFVISSVQKETRTVPSSQLFEDASELFGKSSTSTLISDRRLRISFDQDAAVLPGMSLTLIRQTLVTVTPHAVNWDPDAARRGPLADNATSSGSGLSSLDTFAMPENEEQTVPMSLPEPPERFIATAAKVTYPQFVGCGGQVIFDASASRGAGIRSLNYTWTIVRSEKDYLSPWDPPSTADDPLMRNLTAVIQRMLDEYNGRQVAYLAIGTAMKEAGMNTNQTESEVSLLFLLTTHSYLSQQSATFYFMTRTRMFPKCAAHIEPLQPSEQTIDPTEPVSLAVRVHAVPETPPETPIQDISCDDQLHVNGSKVVLGWDLHVLSSLGGLPDIGDLSMFALNDAQTAISIPGSSLPVGDYHITCKPR
ncbi:unnamed protein product [Vitrella brassicaformis CCMP3155]|uniref:Uncharacterized protein n=1 Tax=Vitrella brassicaformis (strain CCMP3155) TaxID=1169540 RepID=A0A0G4E949_VITBC|nr:unnamed protein product [Vitrella brassicaformis CCMP3155]|eukprot:CEL91726.1 unnamed protein product [Vitrella brassicaformis CCMP3155]